MMDVYQVYANDCSFIQQAEKNNNNKINNK